MFRVVVGCMTFILGCLVLLGVWAWMSSSSDGGREGAEAFATAVFDRNEGRFREMAAFMDHHPKMGMFARKPLLPAPGAEGKFDLFCRDASSSEPGYEDDALGVGLEMWEVRRMLDMMKRSHVCRIIQRTNGTVCMLDLPSSFPVAGCVCIVHLRKGGSLPEVQEGTIRTLIRADGWYVVHNLCGKGEDLVEMSCGDAWR